MSAANNHQDAEQNSVLDVSDDELSSMSFDEYAARMSDDTSEDGADKEDDTEGTEETDDAEIPNEEEKSAETDTEGAEGEGAAEAQQEQAAAEVPVDTADKVPEEADTSKAALDKLFAPFNANGKKMQVDNVDDAITLMQMGANYNKKMAALKPNLKLLKMLDNNGLLDENKLSYLIDIDKKDPSAINQLIKDAGIDPMDINTDTATGYKPKSYTVDNTEVELDTVLESIADTSSYESTLDIISNKWDDASKQVLVGNPSIIPLINEHVENGVYEQINQVVEKERMLGRLTGLSDIEAYKTIGDKLFSAQSSAQPAEEVPAKEAPAAPVNKAPDPKLADKKRAAGPSRRAPRKATKATDFNPLSLSDEDFAKMADSKYL